MSGKIDIVEITTKAGRQYRHEFWGSVGDCNWSHPHEPRDEDPLASEDAGEAADASP